MDPENDLYTLDSIKKERWTWSSEKTQNVGTANQALASKLSKWSAEASPADARRAAAQQDKMEKRMKMILPDGTSVTSETWTVLSEMLRDLNVTMRDSKPQTTIPAVRTLFSRLKALQGL
jgi:hypothetical protein